MKDLIDERNKREKMQNSIIKWWNVNMVPVEEKKDAFAGLSSEEKEAAKQIIARLEIIAIIGNNGAAKSTFGRCLCGIEKAGRERSDL